MSTPVVDVAVGGGAWRVKWYSSAAQTEKLLVACMHDGFKVVKCPFKESSEKEVTVDQPVVISRYDAHTSLAYGVDWQHGMVQENAQDFVASCSFYDHSLHLWNP